MQEIKKICSFIPKNLSTMKNRVIPSSSPLGIRNQKPMKRTIIRKNKKHTSKDLFFNKLVSYLLSDSYMYNPLVCSQPTFDLPPPKQISTSPGGERDMALPIGGSNKKFSEKLVDFLEADCYLYSPLLDKKHVCPMNHSGSTSSGHFQTHGGSSSTETHREREGAAREGGELGSQLRARLKVLKETVAYNESVKHTVHQICCSKSIQGASLEPAPMKLFVE